MRLLLPVLLPLLIPLLLSAQEPNYPESAAAQPNADVEVKAVQVQILHQAEGCELWKADPPSCRKADHFMYWIGKEGFKLADPPAGGQGYTPLSSDYVKFVQKLGQSNEDKDRPGLCTADMVLYAEGRVPCRYIVDVVVTSAMVGHVWRLYARCSGGLLPIFLPVDRGLLPPVSQQGASLDARVGIRLDAATHKPTYQVFTEPAEDMAALEKLLKKVYDHQHEQFPSVALTLVLMADADAPFSSLVDVVTLGRKIGFQQVQLAIPGPK